MRNRNWDIEGLREAIRQSGSLAETFQHLGLSRSGSAYKTMKENIEHFGIDTSHWKPYRPSFQKGTATMEEILSANSPCSSKYVRNFVIRNNLIPYVCACCGISEWQNRKITLQLDHQNGDNTDNHLANLRFLCPNCHSQTENWGGRKRKLPDCICGGCGAKVGRRSSMCRHCAPGHDGRDRHVKAHWPDTPTLLDMIRNSSILAVACQLGVSDKAVKKHVRNHPT